MTAQWGMRVKRNGVEEYNSDTDMGRIIAVQDISDPTGTINDARLLQGYPYAILQSRSPLPYWLPTISISGQTISWDYGAQPPNSPGGATRTPCSILFGTNCRSFNGSSFTPQSAGRFGFRARHSGTLASQIDDLYANLALLNKATFSAASAPEATNAQFKATFSVTSTDTPVVAFACTSRVGLWSVERSGNDWTYTLYANAAGASITAYVFGKPTALGAGWGERIKRGSVILYDSRHRYARVATIAAGNSLSPGSTSLTAGRTYAIVFGLPAGSWTYSVTQVPGSSQFTSVEARSILSFSVNGANVAWQDNIFMQQVIPGGVPGPARSYTRYYTRYSFIALDVTGY